MSYDRETWNSVSCLASVLACRLESVRETVPFDSAATEWRECSFVLVDFGELSTRLSVALMQEKVQIRKGCLQNWEELRDVYEQQREKDEARSL